MPWSAAAAVAAAAISSYGASSSAHSQASAAHDASVAQQQATQQADQTQLQMQQNALNYEQSQTSPYTQAGQTGLAAYMQQLGLTPPPMSYPAVPGQVNPQQNLASNTATDGSLLAASGKMGGALGSMVGPNGQWQTSSSPTQMYAGGSSSFNEATGQGGSPVPLGSLKGVSAPGAAPQTAAVNNGQAQPFDISKMPGYSFQMKEAMDATNNSAAASTGALSGNALKALQDRAQGIASTQYNSYLDRLSGLASLGENSAVNAGNTGVGIVQGAANNISANQMALGNALASNTIGAGNARAAGQVALGNQVGSALNSQAVQGLFSSNSYTPNSGGIDMGAGSGGSYNMPDYSQI